MAGVPTLWLQLTQKHSPFPKTTFPHLRYVTNTGGRLPEPIVRLIRDSHPQVAVYLMYGLTEAFRSAYLPPDEVDRRPSAIGKAIPDVEILVVDDRGRLCQAGEVGELVHRGANVAMGYWRDPDGSARVFRPHPFESARTWGGKSSFTTWSRRTPRDTCISSGDGTSSSSRAASG
jgi:acyl-CoA synthetase (AMP-forming)/AMP-acid ligase II